MFCKKKGAVMQQEDPYAIFPRCETEHFLLRQVRVEDAAVLRALGFQGPKRFREYGGYFWKERV